MLYPQNGDGVLAVDSMTSLLHMYTPAGSWRCGHLRPCLAPNLTLGQLPHTNPSLDLRR